MRKLILNWLFGTDNVKRYMELLNKSLEHNHESIEHHKECLRLIDDHKATLDKSKQYLNDILKLIKICQNHGIDVDKEMKQIEL